MWRRLLPVSGITLQGTIGNRATGNTFGWQPGAGKTVLSSMLNKLLCGNVYFINADEYRRFPPQLQRIVCRYGSDSVQMTQWVFWCGDGAADP